MEDSKMVDIKIEEGGQIEANVPNDPGYGGNCCNSCSGSVWTWCSEK